MSIIICGNCFKNSDGLKYFRKGAIEVHLGSAGQKHQLSSSWPIAKFWSRALSAPDFFLSPSA